MNIFDYWISLEQAQFYTNYSRAFWKKLIKKEIVPTSPELPIERIKEIDNSYFAIIKIPLSVS